MTIRPVHVEGAMTKAQYDALELTRPLSDGPIGATTGARRSTDEAASRCFDEPDRPAGRPTWRPVGPARTTERLELDDQRARNAARRVLSVPERRNGVPGTPIAPEPKIAKEAPK